MTDPAEIIAETILKPPPQTGYFDENFRYQYGTMMALPQALGLASHIATAAVQALRDAGLLVTPPAAPNGALPSLKQIRRWLVCHEWKVRSEGPAGAVWFAPVPHAKGVGIPDDNDPDRISGAIQRIADRMMMSPAQVHAEMLTYG